MRMLSDTCASVDCPSLGKYSLPHFCFQGQIVLLSIYHILGIMLGILIQVVSESLQGSMRLVLFLLHRLEN